MTKKAVRNRIESLAEPVAMSTPAKISGPKMALNFAQVIKPAPR